MVNNGIMFVSTPQNQVIALDARNGDVLWTYKKQLPEDLLQLHPTNRGVALYEDKVYLATVDAHLVALDAKTGKVVWDKSSTTTRRATTARWLRSLPMAK
jgi:alcohol dehydrogenase (cytochrome c)